MLAYLFWHRPHEPAAVEGYEQAQVSFHRSLARRPPVGLCGSAVFRIAEPPWPAPPEGAHDAPGHGSRAGYEDWYVVEDFAALGVLNAAAVGRGHRTSHDELARRAGGGSGGLYALLEGDRRNIRERGGPLGGASLATWVARPAGAPRRMLGELLGDGMDPSHASLWRRQLVLGPAPEFCLLAHETPPGAAPTRLPDGWTATVAEREVLFNG